ncbi:calcium-binding protein [Inhella proteolytica]|uniref:Calcium-binding protein n=1 Tax=Inhella proteolytica TaxID=2795029 RepID=A0A931J429_9BURK|nr:calcium-binding protein [Inhella proteolytica]MBH9579234.1 hypothetical protein [Inhella proteolytica]
MTNILQGTAGDDLLRGSRDDEHIDGGAGNDTLYGGKGRNQLVGGAGQDLALYDDSLGSYRIEQDPASGQWKVLGLNSEDSLDGIEALQFRELRIELSALAQQLQASAADQTFYAYAGRGFIDGGAGNDLLMVDQELSDWDLNLQWDAEQGWSLHNFGSTLRLAGIERIQFSNRVVDLSTAVDGRLQQQGGAGDDRLNGHAGRDLLRGGAGNDVLSGGLGDDQLDGGEGDDLAVLPMGFGAYEFQFEGGRWTLSNPYQRVQLEQIERVDSAGQTLVLADLLRTPGAGDDRLYATLGQTGFDGGAGQDSLVLSFQLAELRSLREQAPGEWRLELEGGLSLQLRSIETLQFRDALAQPGAGAGGRLLVQGGEGGDRLRGHAGDDHLMGGAGDDALDGGAGGNDVLDGGAGDDLLQADAPAWLDWKGVVFEAQTGSAGIPVLQERQQLLLRGGAGEDTVQLTRGLGSYALSPQADGSWRLQAEHLDARLEGVEYLLITGENLPYFVEPSMPPLRLRLSEALARGQGGAGDDTLLGFRGLSHFDGGAGQDLLVLPLGSQAIEGALVRVGAAWQLPLAGGGLTLQGIERLRLLDGEFEIQADGRLKQSLAERGWLGGTAANDWLLGSADDDLLMLSQGEDELDGGAGQDMLYLPGRLSDYATPHFDAARGQWLIEHADGRSWLQNIETLNYGGIQLQLADLNPAPGAARSHHLFKDLTTLQGGSGLDTLQLDTVLGRSALQLQAGDGGGWQLQIDGRSVALRGIEQLRFSDGQVVSLDEPALRQPSRHQASPGDDQLIGNDLGYALWGEGGDDTLEGRGGDDSLYGGKGKDVAVYRGLRSEYRIEPDAQGQFRVHDLVSGRDGNDQLFDIETLRFADGELDLTQPLPMAVALVGLPPAPDLPG